MTILRLQAPEGLSSFSHQGHAQEIGRDGVVLVDHRHAADFTAHGFVPLGEERRTAEKLQADRVFAADPRPDAREIPPALAAPASELSPGAVAFLNRLSATPGSLDRLAAMLEREAAGGPDPRMTPPVAPAPIPNPSEPETPADPPPGANAKLSDEAIDKMTKPQLKVWCREHDVPAQEPIDVDVLREKVRRAQAQE